jgi:hypothetical protein
MSRTIQDQVNRTYFSLRWAAAIIGLAFPLILTIGGGFKHLTLLDSLSAYYHAYNHPGGTSSLSASDIACSAMTSKQLAEIPEDGPMRNWFVGLLFAIGAVLYVNKGHTDKENILLNVAGAFACGIALFPMPWSCRPRGPVSPHGAFAVLFFVAIASILIFCSKDTIDCLPAQRQPYYFRWYYILAGVMLTSPLSAVIINDFIPEQKSKTLALEWVGIYAFSLYWIVRTREIKEVQRYQVSVKAVSPAHVIARGEMHDTRSQSQFY